MAARGQLSPHTLATVNAFFADPAWGQHLGQAYQRGVGKAFDDVRALERSGLTTNEHFAAYAEARNTFINNVNQAVALPSLQRVHGHYRSLVAGEWPNHQAVMTLARLAVVNAYQQGQWDGLRLLGVRNARIRRTDGCSGKDHSVDLTSSPISTLPHNNLCRCAYRPILNEKLRKDSRSPLHLLSNLLAGEEQVKNREPVKARAVSVNPGESWQAVPQVHEQPTGPLLWLVRHGETRLNNKDHSKDRIRAWLDVPLNDDGKQEALRLARFFKDKPVTSLASSDLLRCRETAEEIAREHRIEPFYTKALRPWNVGDYTGNLSSKVAPILKEYAESQPNRPLPGGESFNDFKTRCLTFLRSCLNQSTAQEDGRLIHSPMVLVSHFRVLKLMQAWQAAGMRGTGNDAVIDFPTFWEYRDLSTGSILKLFPGNHQWQLELLPNEAQS